MRRGGRRVPAWVDAKKRAQWAKENAEERALLQGLFGDDLLRDLHMTNELPPPEPPEPADRLREPAEPGGLFEPAEPVTRPLAEPPEPSSRLADVLVSELGDAIAGVLAEPPEPSEISGAAILERYIEPAIASLTQPPEPGSTRGELLQAAADLALQQPTPPVEAYVIAVPDKTAIALAGANLSDKALALEVVDRASFLRADDYRDLLRQADQAIVDKFEDARAKTAAAHKAVTTLIAELRNPIKLALEHLSTRQGQWEAAERRREAEERARLEAIARQAESDRLKAEAVILAAQQAPQEEIAAVLKEAAAPSTPPVSVPSNIPTGTGVTKHPWRARLKDGKTLMDLLREVVDGKIPVGALDIDEPPIIGGSHGALNRFATLTKHSKTFDSIEIYEDSRRGAGRGRG